MIDSEVVKFSRKSLGDSDRLSDVRERKESTLPRRYAGLAHYHKRYFKEQAAINLIVS